MDTPGMSIHWSWGLSTALILTLVIYLNGRRVRAGWLLGAAVQLINMAFGYFVYGQDTFLFLAFPAGMFLANWWADIKRDRLERKQRGVVQEQSAQPDSQ